jgi:hypothetical protein
MVHLKKCRDGNTISGFVWLCQSAKPPYAENLSYCPIQAEKSLSQL